MDWFLYDNGFRHERVKELIYSYLVAQLGEPVHPGEVNLVRTHINQILI